MKRQRVAAELVRDLAVLRPAQRCWQIGTQWLVCAVAISIAEYAQRWPVTVLALIVIATRQHALLVLMHDAVHQLIARRRWVNDVVGNLLLAFPLTVTVAGYRSHHLRHHRCVNSEADPDIADSIVPQSRRRFLALLLQDLSGLSTLATLRMANGFGIVSLFTQRVPGYRFDRALALVFVPTVALVIGGFRIGPEFLLYWIVPSLLFLPAILRVRRTAEHAGRVGQPALNNARSVTAGLIERFLWAPCHTNRHWEHHTCPGVPCYNLPRLSQRLATAYPDSAAAKPTLGYFIGRQSLMCELYPAQARAWY